jgi:hypothetical protein
MAAETLVLGDLDLAPVAIGPIRRVDDVGEVRIVQRIGKDLIFKAKA